VAIEILTGENVGRVAIETLTSGYKT
jgi:hypothetical protein